MASATLSLSSASYDLLEALDSAKDSKLNVKTSGNTYQIKSTVKDNTIEGLGITTGLFDSQYLSDDQDWIKTGMGGTVHNKPQSLSSNVNIFSSVSDFDAALGDQADTLNIFGNVSGSLIQLDNKADSTGNYNDILNIQGNLIAGDNGNNTIYAGGGNDTIRIAGKAEDTNIFLGFGNDSLVISGNASNVDVKGDDLGGPIGNDYIEFRGESTDVRVNSGGGQDTVIFSKGLNSYNTELNSDTDYLDYDLSSPSSGGLAAVELGAGNDSLTLGKGSYENATFNTGSGNDTISIGSSTFSNVNFQLDGAWDRIYNGVQEQNFDGGDKITSAANTWFTSTNFSSNNIVGDTLVFGSGNIFTDTNFYLGQGNDSLVFGSGSTFNNWNDISSTINTGLGADTIVFGFGTSFFDNTTLSLGNDGVEDIVRFAANSFTPNAPEIRIIGADDNDVLFVGTDSYHYDTSIDNWLLNGSDTISY